MNEQSNNASKLPAFTNDTMEEGLKKMIAPYWKKPVQPSGAKDMVAVRELVWRFSNATKFWEGSPEVGGEPHRILRYTVRVLIRKNGVYFQSIPPRSGDYLKRRPISATEIHASRKDAMAACQKHYEDFILSQIQLKGRENASAK